MADPFRLTPEQQRGVRRLPSVVDPTHRFSLSGQTRMFSPRDEPEDYGDLPPYGPPAPSPSGYRGPQAKIGQVLLPEPKRPRFSERPGVKRFAGWLGRFNRISAMQHAPTRAALGQIQAEHDREVEASQKEEKETRLTEEKAKEKRILHGRRMAYGANDPGLLHPDDPQRIKIQEYIAMNPESSQDILGAQLGKSIRQEPKAGPGGVAPEGWVTPEGAAWWPGQGYRKDPSYQASSTRQPSFGPVEDLEDSILEAEKGNLRNWLSENIGLDPDKEIPDPYDELGADMIRRGDLVRKEQMRLLEVENEVQLRKRQLDRYEGRLGDAGAYRGKELPTQVEMRNVENAPELLPGEEFDDYVDRLVEDMGWFPKLAVAAAHSKGLVDPDYTPSR